MSKNKGSVYLEKSVIEKTSIIRPFFFMLFSLLAVISFAFVGLSSSMQATTASAQSSESDKQERELQNKVREAFNNYFKEFKDPDQEGEKPIFDYVDPTQERNTIGGALARVAGAGKYLNQAPLAYTSKDTPTTVNKNFMCNVDDKWAGTPLYHNCDIPNVPTEMLQDLISFIGFTGPKGANVTSSKVDTPAFGMPSAITKAMEPSSDPSKRYYKYSGLELFGYNLRYTNYYGEWDQIRVATSARMLSNFGMMDMIGMSGKAAFSGVHKGLGIAGEEFISGMKKGDIIGAIGGLYSGFVIGSVTDSVNTVLDTSDYNVVANYAWFRDNYGSTLYSARELSNEEISREAVKQLVAMVMGTTPEEAKVPADLLSISSPPQGPKEGISYCEYADRNGKVVKVKPSRAPGISEEACASRAKDAQGAVDVDDAKYTWSEDGTQKAESLKEWVARDKAFSIGEKYNMACKPNLDVKDEEAVAAEVAKVVNCWSEEWNKARDEALIKSEKEVTKEWTKDAISSQKFLKWIQEDPARNFNAPWNRFVCLDSSGKDLRINGHNVKVFNPDGSLNDQCGGGAPRPPIQNGFFGNGYVDGQSQPDVDTRNTLAQKSMFEVVVPIDLIFSSIAKSGLDIAIFFNRIANTVINLSFMPIGEELGINKIVVSLMESYRDGIFFPISVIIGAAVGVIMIFQVIIKRNFREQFLNALLAMLTMIAGVALLTRPAETIKAVETIPTNFESWVMGTIFNFGKSQDVLCSVTGESMSDSTVGFDGEATGNSVQGNVRFLMCESWRAFSFTPWVVGQWGTSYDELYANGTEGVKGTMQNSNEQLVGSAPVEMGGGKTVNNWALYHLSTITSGTAYEKDLTEPNGSIDPDFYRIVDMQAGPNNGAGTDGRYFSAWTGQDYGSRITSGLSGAVTSVVSSVVIISYSVVKIQISIITTIMLIMLPFVLLVGILPGPGRRMLRGYAATILGLMIQRVVLVVLMSLMFKVLIGFANFGGSPLISLVLVCIGAVIFYSLKKEALEGAFNITNGIGRHVAAGIANEPIKSTINVLGQNRFISNRAEHTKAAAKGVVSGGIGSYMSGSRDLKGALAGAKAGYDYETGKVHKNQRRRGFSALESFGTAYSSTSNKIRNDLENEMRENGAVDELYGTKKDFEEQKGDENKRNSTMSMYDYGKNLSAYNDLSTKERVDENGKKFKVNPANEDDIDFTRGLAGIPESSRIYKPSNPKIDINSASEARAARKYMDARAKKRDEEIDKIAEDDSYSTDFSSVSEARAAYNKTNADQGDQQQDDTSTSGEQMNNQHQPEQDETTSPVSTPDVEITGKVKVRRLRIIKKRRTSTEKMEDAIKKFRASQDFNYALSDLILGEKEKEIRILQEAKEYENNKKDEGGDQ